MEAGWEEEGVDGAVGDAAALVEAAAVGVEVETAGGATFCFLALAGVDCLDSSRVMAGEERTEREAEDGGEEAGGLELSSDLRFCDSGVMDGEAAAEGVMAVSRDG